jgi:inner membrane protein
MSNDRHDFLGRLFQSSGLRIVLLGLLVLVLQIPVSMIGALGSEREATRNQAGAEIAQSWGGQQAVTGPFLIVPYRLRKNAADSAFGPEIHEAIFLPEELRVDAKVEVENRSRGIFALPVFTARTTLTGRLPKIDLATLGVDGIPLLDKVQMVLRVSDIHAVDSTPKLRWNGADHAFEPGREDFAETNGLRLTLPDFKEGGEFVVALQLRGSRALYFTPLGRQTEATMTSGWPHPGFQGNWLPKTREIRADGFSAQWSIPYVARGYANAWQRGDVAEKTLEASRFGVEFCFPVDPYRMSERSLKYAGLFIALTFMAVWLFEIRGGIRTHAVQYLLVGAGICLFYLLELSLAEHLGFAVAYFLASAAITAQVGLYSRAVLKAWPRAAAIAALVGALYGLLYVLLRAEDYALLVGSAGLFVALSAVMYLTRRVQWGGVTPKLQTSEAAPEWRPM